MYTYQEQREVKREQCGLSKSSTVTIKCTSVKIKVYFKFWGFKGIIQ